MGLAVLIFSLLEGRASEPETDDLPLSSQAFPEIECACNNCGRVFHETWLHFPCPARCGGQVRVR